MSQVRCFRLDAGVGSGGGLNEHDAVGKRALALKFEKVDRRRIGATGGTKKHLLDRRQHATAIAIGWLKIDGGRWCGEILFVDERDRFGARRRETLAVVGRGDTKLIDQFQRLCGRTGRNAGLIVLETQWRHNSGSRLQMPPRAGAGARSRSGARMRVATIAIARKRQVASAGATSMLSLRPPCRHNCRLIMHASRGGQRARASLLCSKVLN